MTKSHPRRLFWVRSRSRRNFLQPQVFSLTSSLLNAPAPAQYPFYQYRCPTTMSSITPASFYDDGGSTAARFLHSHHVTSFANQTESSDLNASDDTGSFLDDNAHVYQSSKPSDLPKFSHEDKQQRNHDMWDSDVQRALRGDMQRQLGRIRTLGKLEVKQKARVAQTKKDEMEDGVDVALPPRWDNFRIKTDEGRVIVMDQYGEFDSSDDPKVAGRQLEEWIRAQSISVESHYSDKLAKSGMTGRGHTSRSVGKSDASYRMPTMDDVSDTPWRGEQDGKAWNQRNGGDTNGRSWKGLCGMQVANDAVGWNGSQASDTKLWSEEDEASECEWDGFERFKTISEVGVVDSESDSRSLKGYETSFTHQPKKGVWHEGVDRGHGETSASSEAWGTSEMDDRQHGSSKKYGGSGSKRREKRRQAKQVSAYDEDNETYLNGNWGGLRVRVARRDATTMAGWGV